ncbi:MAG: hypothetical protein ACRDKY_04750 [Solirubrobacteraceae bacterium]
MSKPRPGVIAVDAGLVGQTLVEAVLTRVQKCEPPSPPDPVGAALDDADQAFTREPRVEMQLRRAGYLARVVEVELFDPAKQPATWLSALVRQRFAECNDWAAALAAACAQLARAEPVGKPSPDDPASALWRIPGPGGHVRHYVARRTIEEHLQGRDRAVDGDPAELKIPWAYGFLVRACEEVLPHDGSPAVSG